MNDTDKPQTPPSHPEHPAPGVKDTDDLSDIKDVQDQGMLQHKKDADERPKLIQTPAQGRRSGQR